MGRWDDFLLQEAVPFVESKFGCGGVGKRGVFGKSSGGWTFSLHVYPEDGIKDLADWIPLFADNGGYGAFIEHFVYSRNTPNFDWRRALDFSKSYDEARVALTPVTAAPPDANECSTTARPTVTTPPIRNA
jgi:hypothetical protein